MIKSRIIRACQLTYDLADKLDREAYSLKLKGLPSNTIGQQLWCIVGARESYIKAIKAGSWQGFACSLKDLTKESILTALNESLESLTSVEDKLDDNQLTLMFDLLEHEIQHHGQLIRYMYGNKIDFPQSWHKRYTV